jgi:DNA-directed RNA polymerase subunit RPC12/RpoP
MKLQAAVSGNRLTIAGRIDDSASFAALPAQLPAGEIVIDTEGVTFVNSIGMREWIRLLRALAATHRVRLERVADVLMTQMNLIAELAGSVAIASFHAQYACPACGAEAAPLVDERLAPVACPECGSAMELADFPERYLTIFKG